MCDKKTKKLKTGINRTNNVKDFEKHYALTLGLELNVKLKVLYLSSVGPYAKKNIPEFP